MGMIHAHHTPLVGSRSLLQLLFDATHLERSTITRFKDALLEHERLHPGKDYREQLASFLEDAVAQVNAKPKPDLVGLFGRLDDLTAQLPRGTSPDLLHYMHKKSYQKARLFLQGQDPEQGTCTYPCEDFAKYE